MSNSLAKPILVTGSHRSGSTWIGRMLALASEVGYIHEPFNLKHRRGIFKTRLENWFTYICDENGSCYLTDLENCLQFKYNLSEELKDIKSPKDLLRLMRDYARSEIFKTRKKRPLVKAPVAVFSAEFLVKRFNMDVVVLIRHPLAFAGSLKKEKWAFPFDHLLRQPLLMQHHLEDNRSEIEEYARTERDIVDQASLLWNLIYQVVAKYREKHRGWIFIKHEELSQNPIEEFGKLYNRLGLGFSGDIQRKIMEHSFPDPYDINPRRLKLDSKANIRKWQTILTEEEVQRVKEKTHDIARAFYTETDWNANCHAHNTHASM